MSNYIYIGNGEYKSLSEDIEIEDFDFLGWSGDQWAIALARETPKSETFEGYESIRLNWHDKHQYYPGEIEFEGIRIDKNYSAVNRMLKIIFEGD